ncbi:MAG: PASTA domain-containing protein [Eubacteriaceae bacterium]|nr:PASTA domain-containing protein [Eubacteriaceae bacterium]
MRIIFCVGLLVLLFIALSVRLFVLQVVQADDLADRQTAYMFHNIPITASRGDIYDINMNILAKDASCSKIYVFPNNIENPEETAKYLSEKLGMEYEAVLKKISNKSASNVLLKTGVDNTTALEITQKNINGIQISEDKKRYYSDSNFAQYILGFTGTDHNGLYGVEATLDGVLTGVDGIKTVLMDSGSQIIESSSTIKAAAKQGSSVVLTIDSVVQYYAESAAYEAYLKNSAKRVIIIVTEPDTGNILAMAAYPSYSLDDPWEISEDYYNSYYKNTEATKGEQQLGMWANPFTSFIYEPGSTFKTITVSSALEENAVSMESTFNCNGFATVSGVRIQCHIYPRGHGTENLTKAVVNSCNPAMIRIASLMGEDAFYKYIFDYGFGEPTGVMLDGEEGGIFSVSDKVNPVDFATIAFGQGIGVTPIQMIQAVNAVINGGKLITPRIADRLIDSSNGQLVHKYEINTVRKVISEETSAKMREILYQTGLSYVSLNDYRELNIMGKTGTAQKYAGNSYVRGKYVASFYGAAPYEDPVISAIVIVDEPGGSSIYGSTVAAPVGGKLLQNVYNYLISKDKITIDSITESKAATIPDVRGKSADEAISAFNSLGIKYSINGAEVGTVTDQDLIGIEYMDGMVVGLVIASPKDGPVTVPNVVGMSVQGAKELLESVGLNISVKGSGIAVSQSVVSGQDVDRGTAIEVNFEYVE